MRQGLSFCPAWRFHADMDDDLRRIIHRALENACARDADYLVQTEQAVRAVHEARPDMTASDALAAATLVRRW
jgi:hypothetical protein